MRRTIAFLLLLGAVENASAIHRANAKDRAEIADHLRAAHNAAVDINLTRVNLRGKTGEEAENLRAAIQRLAGDRDAARERALWLTIRAYGILDFRYGEPVLPTAVSVLRSPQNGKEITWLPIVADSRDYSIQNEVGRTVSTERLGKDESGNFASDGIARIFPSAFTNPATLASTIAHELIHFQQATTRGRGDVLTPGESEVEAYEAQQQMTQGGIFGFTEEEKEAENAYLEKNLKKRRLQAAKERAEVTRRSGLPIDEFSVASLSADAIARLAAKARQQVRIAQADHDERLRNDLRDIALRSCDAPGIIPQRELNDLPKPHSPFFSSDAPPPADLGDCLPAYAYLLNGGRDSQRLRALAVPHITPVPVQPFQPLVPAQPRPYQPPVPLVPVTPQIPFSSGFPRMRDYAVAACGTTGQVPVDKSMTTPSLPYDFEPNRDNVIADRLAANLGACESQLFRLLIDYIRAGRGAEITASWAQAAAAGFRPVYREPYYDPCRANGNKYCP